MTSKSAETKDGATQTRIQKAKRETILEAALDVFSAQGFRGATVDQIAETAGLSKPNLLYYFPSKDAMHGALLARVMETWLDPMKAIDPQAEPLDEMLLYVRRKLEMSRDYPRESRLFANEILQGAPRIHATLTGELRELVEGTAGIIQGWINAGRLAQVDPQHTLFSIWALTQHYADFDVQVQAVLREDDPFERASAHLEQLFRRLLAP